MSWFDVGQWVYLSQEKLDEFTPPGPGPGPHQIVNIDISYREALVRTPVYSFWVAERHCRPAEEPAKTLVEKEQAALEAETWRKRRDENLRRMFAD